MKHTLPAIGGLCRVRKIPFSVFSSKYRQFGGVTLEHPDYMINTGPFPFFSKGFRG
ncbi:MAG: hypothetical protein ACLPTF_23835 [Steroidobacteraceae bacterium]